jgi:hypothetical protein
MKMSEYNLGFQEGEQAGILGERARFKQQLRKALDEFINEKLRDDDDKRIRIEELIGGLCK